MFQLMNVNTLLNINDAPLVVQENAATPEMFCWTAKLPLTFWLEFFRNCITVELKRTQC